MENEEDKGRKKRKTTLKDQLMKSTELVIPFFKSRIKDETGHSPRFIEVKDIEFNQTVKEESIDYDVFVQLLSGNQSWSENLLIREFHDLDALEDEITRYSRLEQRCSLFPNFKILPLINIEKENLRLTYENNKGYTIYQLGLSQQLVDFTLGQTTAIFHGDDVVDLEHTTTRELIHFLLSHLPLTDEERGSISQLCETHYQQLANSKGGYRPCSLFDPYKLQFIPFQEKDSITMDALVHKGALLSIIPIVKPESNITDRMTDIATIYCQRAYNEFLTNGDVHQTKQSIFNFFEGYANIASKFDMPPIGDLYPHEITLDLQILICHLLVEISKLHGKPGGKTGFEDKDPIRFVYFLLVKKPFSAIQI